jgi:hypothetical protein
MDAGPDGAQKVRKPISRERLFLDRLKSGGKNSSPNHLLACIRVFLDGGKLSPQLRSRHHDALEFPDGETVLPTFLQEGQKATVLQLPAAEKQPVSSAENKNAPISEQLVEFILT